ncbi:MAG: hypothetical protein NC548_29635 [Lachnospiraceae bacterium]|nr:hypothetical protein [Lachnospiraceae bacterium]
MNKIQEYSEAEVNAMEAAQKDRQNLDTTEVSMSILDGDELKDLMNTIISKMETVVSRTMGPYGKNAIIQRMNAIDITKDGYLTVRALNVGKTIAEKSLCSIFVDTAAATNVRAGDGTSSSTKVAASLHRHVQEYLKDHPMNVRDLENTLNLAVQVIRQHVLKKATPITTENVKDAVRKIALLSTNWDEQLADIIAAIYERTGNPIIKRVDSGSTETNYEIMDGYDLAGHLVLQDTYINDFEAKARRVERPAILVFDNTLPDNILNALIRLAVQFKSTNDIELVVMAKGFTTSFVNRLVAVNGRAAKNGDDPVPVTLIEWHAPAAIDRECVLDFCDLVGAEVIAGDSETRGKIDALAKETDECYELMNNAQRSAKPTVESKNAAQEALETMQAHVVMLSNELLEVAGACEELIAGDKSILAKGVFPDDNPMIKTKREKLKGEIDEALRDATAKTMVTNSIYNKQIRLGKLNCSMGIIHVGGHGSAHLKSRNDAVDDAIRACQLAYNIGGYTIGGCYAVPAACTELLADTRKPLVDYIDEDKITKELLEFITMISRAFVDVIQTVMRNKFGDDISPYVLTDSEQCIRSGIAYNIITERSDESLIEPVMVDIEILNSALSLVLTLETTDQYLYTDYDNIGSR